MTPSNLPKLAILAWTLLIATVPAHSQGAKMTFRNEEYANGQYRLVAEGPITDETPGDFERHLKAQASPPMNVTLNSTGGSLGGAMALGRMIRRLRVTTMVDDEGRCQSACAYAYLGGTYRILPMSFDDPGKVYEKQQLLGFHSFTYDLPRIDQLAPRERSFAAELLSRDVQGITSILSNYVAEMGGSTQIVSRSAAIPAGSLVYFDKDELIALNVITWRPEVDAADFELVPDANRLLSVYRHEDHQFTLACFPWKGGAPRPVIVLTQALAPAVEQLPTELPEPIRLSRVLALPALPWTPRDLEHKHFHAHDWIKLQDYNPVFSDFELSTDDERGDSIAVTAITAEFRAEPTFFHAIIPLTPAMAKAALSSEGFSVYFSEGAQRNWGHYFRNKPSEREVLAFALKPCI